MNEGTRLDTARDARGVLTVTLNRPDERNALDAHMVSDLMRALEAASGDPGVRVIVLRGAGAVFSDGTDMRWLDHMSHASYAESLRDATSLATMLDYLDGFPKPVIAAVQGTVTGDALGLVAACDVVVASADTVFQCSELSLGLVPACIAPFLIAKTGGSQARNILLTGRPFDAMRAKDLRLVHDVVPTRSQLDGAVESAVAGMLRGAPQAHKLTKALIRRLTFHGHSLFSTDTLDDVATCLAKSRSSDEVREGLEAWSQGRPPKWGPKPGQ